MFFLKFKEKVFFFLVVVGSFCALSLEDEKRPLTPACLEDISKTRVVVKGLVLGVGRKTLEVRKNRCVIEVVRICWWRLSEDVHLVDVCRHPVHIKVGRPRRRILRRDQHNCKEEWARAEASKRQELKAQEMTGASRKQSQETSFTVSDYCQEVALLKSNIENYGLVYAKGDKENLDAPHGRVACSYELLKRYLEGGKIF